MIMAKVKAKEWYPIVAPKMFGGKVIGETFVLDPESVAKRTVEATLYDLGGDSSRFYFKLFFKITGIADGKASTAFVGHECMRDFIARIVQPRTNRIDTNDVFDLKDAKLRVKTIAITNRLVKASIPTDIRKRISELLKERMSGMTLDEFVGQMIEGKLQAEVRAQLNKIYPIRAFELHKTRVL
ncbi:MAG: 30S ribosomal protein S3ae [Candidatus Aenigmatarchaeota archaeon]